MRIRRGRLELEVHPDAAATDGDPPCGVGAIPFRKSDCVVNTRREGRDAIVTCMVCGVFTDHHRIEYGLGDCRLDDYSKGIGDDAEEAPLRHRGVEFEIELHVKGSRDRLGIVCPVGA